MRVPHHQMPADLFLALAQGGGGTAGIRQLAGSEYSKHLLLLRGVHAAARPGDRIAAEGYRLLTEVQRRDPGAAEAVIRYPSVGAWAVRTLCGDRGASPSGLAAVACAAAVRAGLDATIKLPVRQGRIMLPSLGALSPGVCAQPVTVRTDLGWLEGTGSWRPLRPVAVAGLHAVFDDLDPFRMPTATALSGRLSDADTLSWNAMLDDAWATLSPQEAAEAAAVIRVVVPYQTPPEGMKSSTAPESFGALGMSRHADPRLCGSTLVHEVAHAKLSAVLNLVTLTRADDGSRYYAPWRDDPRPASGLLQGAYAYLAVSGYWRRQHHDGKPEVRARAAAEFARWRAGAASATRTLLQSGQLTPAGHDFATAMHEVLSAWEDEPVPSAALAAARLEAAEHLARWESGNGPVPD
jgi:uncharacterized protein